MIFQRTGNTYSVAGFAQGVYTLDVIAQKGNNQAAYETILVIGPTISPQIQNVIQQRILQETRVDVDTDIVFKNPKQHKPNDKDIVCLYDPGNSLCNPDSSGNCPSGWGTNEDGQCFPTDKDCPEGYWRADDDETGACVPKADSEFDKSELPTCDGSLQDCVTENGDVCEAGSTDHECELDEEESAYFVDEPVEEEDYTESDDRR